MQIYYCTPYSLEKNLGKIYNEYAKSLLQNDNDFLFCMDGDLMFLTSDWGNHIFDLVKTYPDAGIITITVNRVGDLQQCYNKFRSNNFNILDHYNLAQKLRNENYLEVEEINRVISGCCFGFSKKTWEQVGGFNENYKMLKVDNDFSSKVLKLGKKILLAKGLYGFHFYRGWSKDPKHDKKHLL